MVDVRQEVRRRQTPRAKITPIDLPPGWVTRPRLLSWLDDRRTVPVTLVCAPAGFGKSALLAEWVRRSAPGDTAWVSLDTDDNDDRRFWSAVLDALSRCPAVPPGSGLGLLPVPEDPSADAGFLAEVVNALDDLPGGVRLVLDDLQELTAPEPLLGLETLLRHLPAGVRLVLVSRQPPALPLARLRVADQVAELRPGPLKFAGSEASALLAAMGIRAEPRQLRDLVRQSEGWPAALKLAAGALAGDGTEIGGGKAIADYLDREVLVGLPERSRELLSVLSVCEEVSAELASALSGWADAGELLDDLETKTALVVRTGRGRQRFRTLAPLRRVLLGELRRQTPGRASELHARAADWSLAHDLPSAALAHACETGDSGRVAALVERCGVGLILAGELDVVERGLSALSDGSLPRDALLTMVAALLRLEQGVPARARMYLTDAGPEAGVRSSRDLRLLRQLVSARLAQVRGDVGEILATSGEIPADAHAPPLSALAMLHRGAALIVAGDRSGGRELVWAALAIARDGGQHYVALQCLATLACVAGVQGDYRLMVALARQASAESDERGWGPTMAGATTSAVLSYAALLRADFSECARLARGADVDEASAEDENPALIAGTLLGIAEFELGDRVGGLRRIEQSRLAAGEARFSAEQIALWTVVEHASAQQLGWSDLARRVLDWAQQAIPEAGEVLLAKAWAQVALGRPATAQNLLRPVLDGTVAMVLPWCLIEAWLADALAALKQEQVARAVRSLGKALTLAESFDVLYPLVCAAPEVVELLTRRLGKLGSAERFARRVLDVRRSLTVPAVQVPLTERELSVVRLLPTLRSFKEIADDLTISLNTVKTHVRSIYLKLAVGKRRDAVEVARAWGLIENGKPQPDEV
jgi:LuxR family maltose regulon positive regulatory protein